jgi:ubiquinone/menaquinone biosynthesis C-methylase UbiE
LTSTFSVHDAAGYEQLMGRWSQRLAPLFIKFAGLANGEKILDVGCGTGSLTFALAKAADLGEISAIDYSPVFVEAANRRNIDPRIKIKQADACALPFEDGTFDRALALLVLHFVRMPARPWPKCSASYGRVAWSRPSCGTILAACPPCA